MYELQRPMCGFCAYWIPEAEGDYGFCQYRQMTGTKGTMPVQGNARMSKVGLETEFDARCYRFHPTRDRGKAKARRLAVIQPVRE